MDFRKFQDGGVYPGHCFKGLVSMITGSGARKSRKQAQREADRQAKIQREAQKATEAAQLRQQNLLNEQEDKELKDLSGQRRSIVARRRGNGALSFTPASGLKSKLGG